MNFGVIYPASGRLCSRKFALEIATKAESFKLDSLLVYDHYMLPNPGLVKKISSISPFSKGKIRKMGEEFLGLLPNTTRTFESWSLLSFLAGKTEQIKLGTCVTPFPFRNPARLAKRIATIDYLSNGRIIVGVGAGWYKPEFDAFSKWAKAKVRVEKTKEALLIVQKLLTKGKVDFKGKHYKVKAAVEPKPIKKPSFWFGTTGRKMLQLAARYGDGWIPIAISPSLYATYQSWLKKRVNENFTYAVAARATSKEELKEKVKSFRKAGCDHFHLVIKAMEQIEWLSKLQ